MEIHATYNLLSCLKMVQLSFLTLSQAKPPRAYPTRYLPGSHSHAAETPSWLGGAVRLAWLSQRGLGPKDQRAGE